MNQVQNFRCYLLRRRTTLVITEYEQMVQQSSYCTYTGPPISARSAKLDVVQEYLRWTK